MGGDRRERALKVALAGLLHDIGKLGQRAGETAGGRKDHLAVGDKFVYQYIPSQWQALCAPVKGHHGDLSPGGLPTKIVALADRLSAGERERYGEDEPRVEGLMSVFAGLGREGEAIDPLYLPLRPLSLAEEVLFPSVTPPGGLDRLYQRLWSSFCQEMAALQTAFKGGGDLESYLGCVLGILKKYTWAVPSAFYYDRPDVSLYDHARTTAALAACLAQVWEGAAGEREVDALLEAMRGREPGEWPGDVKVAGLVAGDLSGIQPFLYSLHHARRAGAALRARSFYIQLLAEVGARRVLRELGLPAVNILYLGGGTFTLIVPPDAEGALEEIAATINELLLDAHRGALYLALGFVPLTPRDFGIGGPLGEGWKTLRGALERQKARRFAELSPDNLRALFAPFGGATDRVCGVCGEEAPHGVEDDEGVLWCPMCGSMADLGLALRRARFALLGEVPPHPLGGEADWRGVLRALGAEVAVAEEVPEVPPGVIRHELWSFDPEADPPWAPDRSVAYKPFVNTTPLVQPGERIADEDGVLLREGEIKHLGVLAHQSKGAPYLGVLRMDMDGLGRIFREGLGARDTLSRRATLSFHLSLFFEGWVGELARRLGEAGGQRLYAIYSGGDDLLFVGSWDAVVELARAVRRDLARFTGRSDLGISGGVVLVHEKYPLYLAAERAHGAEESAKGLRPGKDAFSFLEVPLPWERFGYGDGADETVASWARVFRELLAAEGVSRALVRRVQDFYLMYAVGSRERGPWGPWVWRAAYTLARAAERLPAEQAQRVRALAGLLSGQKFAENIRWLAVAARWAELATRQGRDDGRT